jgi:Uma2 family endonuclease
VDILIGLKLLFKMLLKKKHLPRYTVKDYEGWEGDWELVEGIPYALASPSFKHQRILGILFMLWELQLENEEDCKNCKLTIDTDYIVNEHTVFRPDLALVCDNFDEKITKPPILIAEVVSPSSKKMDEEIKPMYYAREGVRYYLLIYPESEQLVLKTLKGNGKYSTKKVKGKIEIPIKGNCKLYLDPDEVWRRV